ncbi:SDA1-domain-containing protein [Fomitiporia mediterranea MF3/22]|uniref:SDA1-domain-containing protein n=1 Tax=Fomitiporia mediterranea (strain MF3/22) TaxID=694068 RepID=UPI0004408822|nr:SDA1-domain-containing protein [Fomitiporia mediterranea MF3/22]EJD07420.1 SDA1-domain-containing protein [Fomitiporia mediterranea MF3/22]
MVRSHAGRGALLSSNLPQLQNLIKRDPSAYKEEFLQQWNHYKSILSIFQANPVEQSEQFRDMITFISQVSPCYPKETANFSEELSSLLLNHYGELNVDTKKSLISNLIILRKKDVITPVDLLKTLFPLLPRTSSPTLRSFIRKNILQEIRNANAQRNNLKLNRAVQAMLFRMVEQGSDMDFVFDKGKKPIRTGDVSHHSGDDALWAVFMTKDLWRKGIWNDAKSVAIISLGCFHPITKVQSAALHFFLDEEDGEDSSEEEDEGPDVKALQHRRTINKKTRSGDKKLAKSIKTAKKKSKSKKSDQNNANFAALQLLQDPQTFAEKLFDILSRFDKRYTLEHKILNMQVLCRAMGTHRLCVLPFYTYLLKYLAASQLRIPTILAALASSVHSLTPPDVLTPVLRKVAHEFVHPGVGSEVVAAGLNAIREVCARQPWAMEEDLLGDLVEYKKSKDKGVIAAARGLLHLYRQEAPSMLKRRERGKEASMKGTVIQPVAFGQEARTGTTVIDGLDLLEDHIRKIKEADGDDSDASGDKDDDEDGWAGWEVASDSDTSSSSDGWMDVSSDSEHDLEISDSEDEKDNKKKRNVDDDDDSEKDEKNEDEKKDEEEEDTKKDPPQSIILTPADFALLNELRSKNTSTLTSKKRKRSQPSLQSTSDPTTIISESDILGAQKKLKSTYAERIASIQSGREGREKFGSAKGKKRKEAPSSSTNREKKRNKPLMMIMASKEVRGKKKASLVEKQRRMRKHNENQQKKRK